MNIIIESVPLPNGYLKVSAIDELTGVEEFVYQKPRNIMHVNQMQKLAIQKLMRKLETMN